MSKYTNTNDPRLPLTDESVPVIALEGLKGNEPTHLKGLQINLAPHVDVMMLIWWIILIFTLGYVTSRFVLIPMIKHKGNREV